MLCIRVGFEMPKLITIWYIIKVDFCMQNLNPKIKKFIFGVVLIIANNIDQNLKVERVHPKVKLRWEKSNQTKNDNSKNLLGWNMEGYKWIFYFNWSNEWVRHNNIHCRNWNHSWNWHLMTHFWSSWNFIIVTWL